MFRFGLVLGLLASFMLVAPAKASDQSKSGQWKKTTVDGKEDKKGDKKDDKKEDKKDEKKSTERYITLGTLSGQIVRVGEGGNTFTLRVRGAVPSWVPTRIWYGRVQGRTQYTPTSEDIDIALADEAKIRIPFRPELDEKGRPKPGGNKRDPKDRDNNLGGMKGEPGDLAKDQMVTVTLGRSSNPKNPQVVGIIVLVQQDPTGMRRDRDKDKDK